MYLKCKWAAIHHNCYVAFTPAKHCLRTFSKVQEHLQTWRKGFCSHRLSHIYKQLFSNIRQNSQHGTRVIKTLHLCCVHSDTIRNRETPPEEDTQNVGIFIFERNKLCATASKFKGGWNIHILFTLDAQQTLNLFEHLQVYRQAAEHLRTFLSRVHKPYSARASVYTNRASIR